MQAHPVGTVIFIRRSSETGAVGLLGRTFGVEALWPHRLVRCEINLNAQSIRFHALAVVGRITSRSCTKRPTAFPKDASSSDREVMAPPVDSCFVRPRGAGTWPIGANCMCSCGVGGWRVNPKRVYRLYTEEGWRSAGVGHGGIAVRWPGSACRRPRSRMSIGRWISCTTPWRTGARCGS